MNGVKELGVKRQRKNSKMMAFYRTEDKIPSFGTAALKSRTQEAKRITMTEGKKY